VICGKLVASAGRAVACAGVLLENSGCIGVVVVALVPVLVIASVLAGQAPPQNKAPDQPAAQARARSDDDAPPSSASDKKAAGSSRKSSGRPANKSPAATSVATRSKSSAPAAEEDVHVRTQAEMRKPKSPFLQSPGSSPDDRYGPDGPVDWNEVPAWRQASFFGIRAQGLFFVYVVDCSGSMIDDDRLPRATIELRKSVFALKAPQRFEVIFYNSESIPMPGGPIPRSADQQAKNQLLSWLRLIEPDGGTDPRMAVQQALSLRPDAVFLLSDGVFPQGTVDEITKLNTQKIPIHTVDLTGGLAGDHLKKIAQANGGTYASRPGDLQGRP
jgi:hypothetical protein